MRMSGRSHLFDMILQGVREDEGLGEGSTDAVVTVDRVAYGSAYGVPAPAPALGRPPPEPVDTLVTYRTRALDLPLASMYTTCIFCHSQLGSNELVEHFPVGRRLAFDAGKGRLWVVCRKCQRWNLTPLEERWEAIEECERLFPAAQMRASTDHIGLAKHREGLELVRIGSPVRPEFAAWRYGDQFGRRKRKQIAIAAGTTVVAGTLLVVGPVMGLIGGSTALILSNSAYQVYNAAQLKRVLMRLDTIDGVVKIRPMDLAGIKIGVDETSDSVSLTHVYGYYRFGQKKPQGHDPDRLFRGHSDRVTLNGNEAIHFLQQVLPALNRGGATQGAVRDAVGEIETAGDPRKLIVDVARRAAGTEEGNDLYRLPSTLKLAMEMAVNEDTERAALEGELASLEASWKEAEEIAAIADDMFLPASIHEFIRRHRKS
jgi:hypothetical protein